MKIKGTFDVALEPLETFAQGSDGIELGRMSIQKTFHGPLSAKSRGEMLTAVTPVKGSAGYVAIEHVQGTLGGKKGGFVLQHSGIMAGGEERLALEVVPNSGTGDLAGLSGTMDIKLIEGTHAYGFEFTL